MNGNTRFPTIELAIAIDIINVAWLSDNGPLGNFVSSFCKWTKLTEAHPFIDPNDAVSKFPKKPTRFKWWLDENKMNGSSPQIAEYNWRRIDAFDPISNQYQGNGKK